MPFEKGETPEGAKPFKEGESGNPSGRPKGSRNRSTIVREILELLEETKNPITQKNEKLSQEQIMTLAVLNRARKGDVRAYQALMDSAFGAPKQQVEQSNDGNLIIKIIRGNNDTTQQPSPGSEGDTSDSKEV